MVLTNKAAMRSIMYLGSLGSILRRVTLAIATACGCHKKPLFYPVCAV
jgi:hypothetical protein